MNCNTGIWWKTLTAAAAVGILAAGPVAAQKTTLVVYTALETDQIKAYQEGFNKAYPDIEITWVRDSTGRDHDQAARPKRTIPRPTS